MFGPILRGLKVTLRPPDETDPAHFAAWLADAETTRYLGGSREAFSAEKEQAYFQDMAGSKADVFWVIEAEGRAIGSTRIARIDWQNAHGHTGTFIGDKSAWRKGYGSETMAVRTEYAFRELNLHKLTTGAFMENEPSRRALLKVGYRAVGIERQHFWRDGRWHDHWLAELLREDWERSRQSNGASDARAAS
jgi:RimJ/RimL family protein N-acetyltransferase